MSTIGLRFTPPDESYEGFKFRMARTLCHVFGSFVALFILKHAVVFHANYTADLLPEPFRIFWHYLWAYYFRTPNGALELLLISAGFGGVFWLNLPKQYFAGRYRDYGKEKASAEAKSMTLFLTLMAVSFVVLSVPLLTLHFPGWVSLLLKYGPIGAGILQYLSLLPDTKDLDRMPAIDKLGWDMRSFDSVHRSTPNPSVQKELKACEALIDPTKPEAADRFLTQGSAIVTWSGVDAMFRSLETVLGVSAESITLHRGPSEAIEYALGELLDARGSEPTIILTSNAEHRSLRHSLNNRLRAIYRFELHTVDIQSRLWRNASSKDIVAALLHELVDKKPHIAVLSHVFTDTGAVLDVKELIDSAQKQGLTTLFVIDGSQAIGNISVSDDVFVRSAYYAFPGHGWLLGAQPVGFLIRNGWLLRVTMKLRQTASGVRPYSNTGAIDSPSPLPSGEFLASWFTLNCVLKQEWTEVGIENATKHSLRLANLFRTEMLKIDLNVIGIRQESSIVVVTGFDQLEAVCRTLETKRLDVRIVKAEQDGNQRLRGIRFCFHHYHSDEDVRDLAELIGNTGSRADGSAADDSARGPIREQAFRQTA